MPWVFACFRANTGAGLRIRNNAAARCRPRLICTAKGQKIRQVSSYKKLYLICFAKNGQQFARQVVKPQNNTLVPAHKVLKSIIV